MQDDTLEVFSDTGIMGKSLGSDLLAEKKTYLMIAALERAPDQVRRAVETATRDLDTGLAALRETLLATGVKEEAEAIVRNTINQAVTELLPLGRNADPLREFAHLVLNRKK